MTDNSNETSYSYLSKWWNHRCNCNYNCMDSDRCLPKSCSKSWDFIKRLLILIFTLKGYVPSNLYTTDFRLLFVLTAIYTSLITQFRQAGNQEAEEDVVSGRLFRINANWTNHSVTGGVSDRVLWNCRSDSETSTYYKSLYLGLIIFCCMVIAAYLISSMVINGLVAFAVSKVNFRVKGRKVYYLEIVANEVKKTQRLRKNLRELKHEWLLKDNKENLEHKIEGFKAEWKDKRNKFENNKHLYNWFTVLYIIPRIETMIMLSILTFALTSYDIHPIGCLSPIDVSYNEEESSVILKISENVIRYQRASAVLIILLFILWLLVKLIQFLFLPRSQWGLQIEKSRSKWCYCCPWTFSCVHNSSQQNYAVIEAENPVTYSKCSNLFHA